ncbi:MAG: tetratricopeptide repeat protein [Burkholderiaceae bacterium]|nr:MAG: tetratricopeptide repeat protein [Burkholderiaceae bacterium]
MKNCFYICLLIVFAKLVNAEEFPVKEIERIKKEASLAISEGNLQKALESYAALANEYPTNLEVANDVAVILAGLGRLNEARQVLEVAFQKHPKVGKAFINLREILARQASVEYRKALDKKPPSTSLVLQSENIDLTRKYEIVKVDRVEIEKNNDALNEIGTDIPLAILEDNADSIKKLVFEWAEAWSKKEFENYINFYSKNFKNKRAKSFDDWSKYREPRVDRRGKIKLSITKIKVDVLTDGIAEVSFNQRYQSGSTRLFTRKKMRLKKEGQNWKIVFEG